MSKPMKFRDKWRIQWKDYQGIRRSSVFHRYADAEKALRRYQVESDQIRSGVIPTPLPQRSFTDLSELWLATRAKQKRSGEHDECILRVNLLPHFKNLPIDAITQSTVDEYINQKRSLSVKTVHNHITLLVSLLNMAHSEGWLSEAPSIKKPKLSQDADFHYLKTIHEIQRFLTQARLEGEHIHFFYAVAIYTGLRAGELAALRWDDINFETGLICVQRSFTGPTKSGRVRYVPILDALRPLLIEQRLQKTSHLVFINRDGTMQGESARIFQEILHRTLAGAGFSKITCNGKERNYIVFHDLRHTFGSHWVMNGGDIFKLQKILGHQSISMTMRYAHLSPTAYSSDRQRFGDKVPGHGEAVVVKLKQSNGISLMSSIG